MVGKVLKVLSYGKKVEKYALSIQVVARALKQMHDELSDIWNDSIVVVNENQKSDKKASDV